MIKRRVTKKITVGEVPVGGQSPITVQSMTKTDTRDIGATLRQIERLTARGCDIVRCAVPDETAALALGMICNQSPIPVIADIHFNHKFALMALESGCHGLRLNPGNMDDRDKVKVIAREAAARHVPIRIGVNSGSISKEWRWKVHAGEFTIEEAMVRSALKHIHILEDAGFDQIKIALKSSDVLTTIRAYRLMASKCDYPFHVGVTEAGTMRTGVIKSCIGIGTLLTEGLVDTLRVSLTAEPEEEVFTGIKILQSLGLRQAGPELVSCPTCGRVQIDLMGLANRVERALINETLHIKVAVMGCVVNGPGEAAEADVGIAGGKGSGVIFRKGEVVRTVAEENLFSALLEEIQKIKMEKQSLGYQ